MVKRGRCKVKKDYGYVQDTVTQNSFPTKHQEVFDRSVFVASTLDSSVRLLKIKCRSNFQGFDHKLSTIFIY